MKAPRITGFFVAALAACLCTGTVGVRAQTLVPTDDNNVLKSQATTVQGNGTTFTLKEASAAQSNARIAFLKFNLSTVPSIADQATFTATTTTAATADFTLRTFALDAGATGFDWTEDTITYNNRPAPSTTGVLVDTTKATVVGADTTISNGAAAGATASFTFSGLNTFRQSDNTLTLIFLVSSQSNGSPTLSFASSESATAAPTLTIVPEPTAAAVLLAAASGLLLRRRRRSPG